MSIVDPIVEGMARGWRVVDASTLEEPTAFEADVCIVGTGAGGGMTAEILTQAGLDVILVEEGPLRSSRDFRMKEADAYPELYQESAARKTPKAIKSASCSTTKKAACRSSQNSPRSARRKTNTASM